MTPAPDLIMPGLSGMSLVREMRALRSELLIVLMSGYSDEMVAREASLDAGISMLPKPVVPEHLFAALESALVAGPA